MAWILLKVINIFRSENLFTYEGLFTVTSIHSIRNSTKKQKLWHKMWPKIESKMKINKTFKAQTGGKLISKEVWRKKEKKRCSIQDIQFFLRSNKLRKSWQTSILQIFSSFPKCYLSILIYSNSEGRKAKSYGCKKE